MYKMYELRDTNEYEEGWDNEKTLSGHMAQLIKSINSSAEKIIFMLTTHYGSVIVVTESNW